MALTKEEIAAIAAEIAAIESAKQEAVRQNSLWRRAAAATRNNAVTFIRALGDRIVIGFIIGLVVGVAAARLDFRKDNPVPPPDTNVVVPPDNPAVGLDAKTKSALVTVINETLESDFTTAAEFREAVRDELKKKGVTLPETFQTWWKQQNAATPNTLENTRAAYKALAAAL
ncbi:MAG: hypothetical protein LBT89_02070 [Planctomycetaceae bacterium]|jgi:hypothetical protein|nr:hypothetical protein [Planctomycetaceae bacterium]